MKNMNTGMKKRGRPSKKQVANLTVVPTELKLDIVQLSNLDIDPRMMNTMESGLPIDNLISHEGGVPCATNIMCIGDPGVGKTTVGRSPNFAYAVGSLIALGLCHTPGKLLCINATCCEAVAFSNQ